jgi:hypothetical protein
LINLWSCAEIISSLDLIQFDKDGFPKWQKTDSMLLKLL